MDTVAVHPNFRGYGLQRLLISQAEEALSKTQYRYLLCTVHPENSFHAVTWKIRIYVYKTSLEIWWTTEMYLSEEKDISLLLVLLL